MLAHSDRSPRILLFGGSGQTGWELERSLAPLGEVVPLARSDVDFADGLALGRVVREHRPALIVNAAAYNAVDRAEQEEHLAMAVNGVAPGILAEEARRLGAMLVHFSSDYVFGAEAARLADGTPRRFTEQDAPAPVNAYGRSKLAGEQAICSVGGPHVILRTSWVYSRRGRTFFSALLRGEFAGELRIVDDQFSCPTWARSLADATAQLLASCWASAGRETVDAKCSTLHFTGGCWTSRYRFVRALLALRGKQGLPTPRLTPISTSDYPAAAARPAYSVLDCSQARRRFGIAIPGWQTTLPLCIAER